jgi:hypothetical protein
MGPAGVGRNNRRRVAPRARGLRLRSNPPDGVARIERNEIRDQPGHEATPAPGFAALNPGYSQRIRFAANTLRSEPASSNAGNIAVRELH